MLQWKAFRPRMLSMASGCVCCDAGEKVWFIPIGWRARGSTGPVVKEMYHDFSHDQVFVLTTNGTMRIEKYDMEVYRTIDDHIYLNEPEESARRVLILV